MKQGRKAVQLEESDTHIEVGEDGIETGEGEPKRCERCCDVRVDSLLASFCGVSAPLEVICLSSTGGEGETNAMQERDVKRRFNIEQER